VQTTSAAVHTTSAAVQTTSAAVQTASAAVQMTSAAVQMTSAAVPEPPFGHRASPYRQSVTHVVGTICSPCARSNTPRPPAPAPPPPPFPFPRAIAGRGSRTCLDVRPRRGGSCAVAVDGWGIVGPGACREPRFCDDCNADDATPAGKRSYRLPRRGRFWGVGPAAGAYGPWPMADGRWPMAEGWFGVVSSRMSFCGR